MYSRLIIPVSTYFNSVTPIRQKYEKIFGRIYPATIIGNIARVTYKMNLADWFVVQYDVQYVIHPSANPSFSNAIAGGIRLELLFCKY